MEKLSASKFKFGYRLLRKGRTDRKSVVWKDLVNEVEHWMRSQSRHGSIPLVSTKKIK